MSASDRRDLSGPLEPAVPRDTMSEFAGYIRTTLLDLAEDPQAPLKDRLAQTARELHANALKAAALLQDRADIVGQPSRLDYPAEIKRWQAFADKAEQMAKRWEQPL